jgi:hypothetical protein
VKTSFLSLALILCLSLAVHAQGRAATAGQVELRKYESRSQPEPPPHPQKSSINRAQLQHEADELSNLAQSIPGDMMSVSRGTLPKDLLDRLKKIEKLSKHLRSELGPQ